MMPSDDALYTNQEDFLDLGAGWKQTQWIAVM